MENFDLIISKVIDALIALWIIQVLKYDIRKNTNCDDASNGMRQVDKAK